MYVLLPVCHNRPENVIGRVVIDAEFFPALKLLGLDWWYIGDRRREKGERSYMRICRSIQRSLIGKFAPVPQAKHYNLLLHRVIAVGMVYHSIPTEWPELIQRVESIGVVKVLHPWDYTRNRLEIQKGTGRSSRRSVGVQVVDKNPMEQEIKEPPPRAMDESIMQALDMADTSWAEDELPRFMFPEHVVLPKPESPLSPLGISAEEEERRARELRQKEQDDLVEGVFRRMGE